MPWSYPADIKFTDETFLMRKLCTPNTGRKPTTKHDFQRIDWSTSTRPQRADKTETKQREQKERRKNGPDKKRAGKKKGEKSGEHWNDNERDVVRPDEERGRKQRQRKARRKRRWTPAKEEEPMEEREKKEKRRYRGKVILCLLKQCYQLENWRTSRQ